jgi:K+-sensing histidine kinase KdpD
MEHPRDPKLGSPAPARLSRRSEPRLVAIPAGPAESPPEPRDQRGLREDEVSQIVHDLRDPLATIALEAYVLDRKLAHGDQSDGRHTVARIIRNVEFLDRVVQDLLDSCAVGDGRLQICRRSTELRALIERVIDRAVSTREGGRVLLEAPFPVTMSVDDLRIERVIANLIGNALKYTPKDGRIVVWLEAGALAARISVTDTGPGLAPADQEHVFDKYRRCASACGRDGNGLGLYVSKAIVEAHGGQIGVQSTKGEGSQFYFDLPAV